MKKKKYSPESKKEILRQRSKENRRKAKELKSNAAVRLERLETRNQLLRKEYWIKETELEYLNMLLTTEAVRNPMDMATSDISPASGMGILTQGVPQVVSHSGGTSRQDQQMRNQSTMGSARAPPLNNSSTPQAPGNNRTITLASSTQTTSATSPTIKMSSTTTQVSAQSTKEDNRKVTDKRLLNSQKQSSSKTQGPLETTKYSTTTTSSVNPKLSSPLQQKAYQNHPPDMQQQHRYLHDRPQQQPMQQRPSQLQQYAIPQQNTFNAYPQQQTNQNTNQHYPEFSNTSRLDVSSNSNKNVLGADESKPHYLIVDNMEKTQDSFDHSQDFAFDTGDSNFKFDQSSVERSSMGHLLAAFHHQQEATEDSMSFESWLSKQHLRDAQGTMPYNHRADFSLSKSSSAHDTSSTQSKPRPRNFLEALEQEK
mmetsp:Transcript_10887/g.40604  ORF Transcript_10887/g.40604 Transcript_10887/m.40604 type:complete len:425 (+) Transcript_10887:270-1544(+)